MMINSIAGATTTLPAPDHTTTKKKSEMGSLGRSSSSSNVKQLLSEADFSSISTNGIKNDRQGNVDHQIDILRRDASHTKLTAPASPPDSVSESNKKSPSSSDFEHITTLSPSGSSLKFHALKFDVDGDVAIQSPDRSLWEFFTDQLDGDFMICSPVRNVGVPSPSQSSNSTNCYPYQSLIMAAACSPPRMPSWPLGPLGTNSTSTNRGKGLSPLHKVFNSPNNQTYMEVESLSLPALHFLDDLDVKDDVNDDDTFPPASSSTLQLHLNCNDATEVPTSSDCFDLSSVPELLDSLAMPTSPATSSFCPSITQVEASFAQLGSQLTQGNDDLNYQLGSNQPAPLMQQLQQERRQEKQERQGMPQAEQKQNLGASLMVPIFSTGPEEEQDSGLRLVHLLLACAEAVAKEDYMLARRYIHHLNRVVTPLGDSMQRVASCFAEALVARLAATLTAKPSTSAPKPLDPFPLNSLEILKIYQILYQACPYVKFAHFTANQAIFEAFEAEERVHVIDLDVLQGYQWPAFMQALAARPGGAPFLRITGVGPSLERVRETGRCLSELAHSLHIPFEYHPVGEQLEDLKPHMFNRRVGEALAVNSVNRLHRVPSNSLGNLLAMIRDQAPNIVTIVEQEASHNGPYFLGRFLEALHYYSAIFDSLDATFPADSSQRAKVEQYIFAPEIMNIVACEGPERMIRHERLEKWRRIMEGKGFKGVPLSANAVTQSKILLGLYSCDGYRLTEDMGCLLLGWQDRAILAASAWQC